MTTARDVIANMLRCGFDGKGVVSFEAAADAIVTALLSADESVRLDLAKIPKGFMLVPIEATAVMMNAGVEAAGEAVKPSWPGAGCPGFRQIRAAWAAMLEVAPAPPSEDKT